MGEMAMIRRSWCQPLVVAALTLVWVLSAGSASAHPDANDNRRERHGEFVLTILHNNDGESDLIADGDFGGSARFSTLMDDLRSDARREGGVVVVSSGDNFLASPEWNASIVNQVFYDALLIERIGYDALAIGNHEFDFGPAVLADFIGQFRRPVPFLSSNLDFSHEPDLESFSWTPIRTG